RTFTEAVEARPAGRTVVVTFDDAYASVLHRAKPILDELGVPATVFVPTDWPGRGEPMAWPGVDQWLDGEHRDELLPMTWDDLRAVAGDGWEVGAHTCSHPRLTRLGDAELHAQLEGSRRTCEAELGRPCASLAYPYGDCDDR